MDRVLVALTALGVVSMTAVALIVWHVARKSLGSTPRDFDDPTLPDTAPPGHDYWIVIAAREYDDRWIEPIARPRVVRQKDLLTLE